MRSRLVAGLGHPTRISCHCWLFAPVSANCTTRPPSAVDAIDTAERVVKVTSLSTEWTDGALTVAQARPAAWVAEGEGSDGGLGTRGEESHRVILGYEWWADLDGGALTTEAAGRTRV